MRGLGIPRPWRRPPPPLLPPSTRSKKFIRFPRIPNSRRLLLRLLLVLAFIALIPPIFFHFRLRRFQQMRMRKCGWLEKPPLVCAHGGDSSKAAPNTIDAYQMGYYLLFMTGRDLQRMSGNKTAKVGHMSMVEIKRLDAGFGFRQEFHKQEVPTLENALASVSSSVRQVILDAKVGPPSFEKGLAKDILSLVDKSQCRNCLVWAKSDTLVGDVIKISQDVMVGYIFMKDHLSSARNNLLRIKEAGVVGVYHPLVDEKLVNILHGQRKKVYPWTVDDGDSMRRILLEHVDAIVTSNPSLLQGLMQDLKAECLEEGFPLP